jgi:hypothetical protein
MTAPPPAPTLSGISPTSAPAGVAGVTITATGTNYVAASVVRVNGVARPTTFVSATQLTATLTAADVAFAGALGVTVFTPAPGGGTSSAATFTVVGPTLTLDRTTAPLNGPLVSTFANGPGIAGEWLGIYPSGSSSGGSYVDWQWSNGGQSVIQGAAGGSLTWPTGGRALAAGSYVIRWWATTGALLAQSPVFTLADIPPAPTIAGLEPASVVAGSAGFTLRVHGTGFRTTSVIRIGGDRATTVVSSTQLTTSITAAEIAAEGSLSVAVMTPAIGGQGGGTSNVATLLVTPPPPAPTLSTITPTSVGVGALGATVTATGANFVATSVVTVNGAARPTTFVSGTQLTATLLAADVAAGGTLSVAVVTPAPGGGTSSAATLTVVGPTLALDRTTAPLIGPLVATFANGPGRPGEWFGIYPSGSSGTGGYLDWQWSNGGQTIIQGAASGSLTWPTGGRALAAGSYVIRWWASTGGLLAQSAIFALADVPPTPTITTLDPPNVVAGSPGFILRVRGTGYRATSVIAINGGDRATTVVSATELTTAIAAGEVASVGSLSVSVSTPAVGGQGGGTSGAVVLTVVAAPSAPTITGLSPASVAAGTASLALTVTGENYVGTSVVQVNGISRPTTYVSATQLSAVLPAADLALAGNRSITVVTPAPGGGTSAAATLAVVGPSLVLDRTSAPLSGPVQVTFTNGTGTAGEWVGLYRAGTVGSGGYADWQWMAGGQSAVVGATSGTLTFPTGGRAVPAGVYVFRWWSADSRLLAETATITFAP